MVDTKLFYLTSVLVCIHIQVYCFLYNTGRSGANAGGVAGGVVGTIFGLILMAVLVAVVVIVLWRVRTSQADNAILNGEL